jgi:hypothetical protein
MPRLGIGIELEATAESWAIKQCCHYLLGCPSFHVQTNQHLLVGIFNKELAIIDNHHLSCIRELVLG